VAVWNVVNGIDGAAVALADGSKVPAMQIARFNAGEGRVAAVGAGDALSWDGGGGSSEGDANDGDSGDDLGEHVVGLGVGQLECIQWMEDETNCVEFCLWSSRWMISRSMVVCAEKRRTRSEERTRSFMRGHWTPSFRDALHTT
jgi:hypothetical protein